MLAAALALTLAAAGCTDDSPGPSPEPTGSESSSTSPSPTGSPSPSPTEATSSEATDALAWKPVAGPVEDEVTVSGRWRLTRKEGGGAAQLSGPRPRTIRPPDGFRITDALIDGQYAVLVAQQKTEQQPNVATVIDLRSGKRTVLDGDSDVPTTTGGTWTLGSGLLVHATTRGRDYCLATVDLLAGRSRLGPCVEPRHGITNARLSPAGLSAMTFDDSRPSCRTLNRVEGARFVPLTGPEECKGWEAVTTETAAVWSIVPNERQIETGRFFADNGSGPVELGPGSTGTLTWCGDAAYFVRDPQRDSDPARLLRVTPDGGTEVVYESPGHGNAFLAPPRCGGTDLTLTAFSEAGDEQVTAPVR